MLIGEKTYEKIKERIICEPVGPRQFKGKDKEVMVNKSNERCFVRSKSEIDSVNAKIKLIFHQGAFRVGNPSF